MGKKRAEEKKTSLPESGIAGQAKGKGGVGQRSNCPGPRDEAKGISKARGLDTKANSTTCECLLTQGTVISSKKPIRGDAIGTN